jgi:hypothetical protein
LHRRVAPRVGDLGAAEPHGGGRMPAGEPSPTVEDVGDVLRHEPAKPMRRECGGLRPVAHRLGTVRPVVCQDQLDVATEAERAKERQAVDRRQVAGLEAEPMIVEARDRRIVDGGGHEAVARRRVGPPHPRGLILEPCLVGRHLPRLRRAHAGEVLLALPTFPRELVVVPHAHERPARTRILEVGVRQVAEV